MYEATITLKFNSKWNYTGGIYDDEMLPEENITFEVPAQDLNAIQLFNLFGKFATAMGHNQAGIDKGALSLVFNEMRNTEDMRKAAEEFDLKLVEDLSIDEKWNEQNKVDPNHWENRYWELRKEMQEKVSDLKAKLSRYEQPDNPQYTDEELEAMELHNKHELRRKLEKASIVCNDCGTKYGEYSVGCSSSWEGQCNVCGQTKSVTESRDYGYLMKGIKELINAN